MANCRLLSVLCVIPQFLRCSFPPLLSFTVRETKGVSPQYVSSTLPVYVCSCLEQYPCVLHQTVPP